MVSNVFKGLLIALNLISCLKLILCIIVGIMNKKRLGFAVKEAFDNIWCIIIFSCILYFGWGTLWLQ